MKLTLSRFLVENEGKTPNISTIKTNLKQCIEKAQFVYRGSETKHDGFGEKEKREGRSSLTNSNVVMNFTSAYFKNLPDRKKSYFGTNSPMNASEFGDIFVIVPHDDVKEFAVVSNDFNLRDNKVFNEIQHGLDLSGFGYQFTVSIQSICRKLKDKNTSLPVDELSQLVTKLSSEHKDIGETEFEKLDSLFNEVFSSGEPHKVRGYHDTNFANYVWEVVSSKYDGSFIRFMKHAVNEGISGVKVVSFTEALDTFKDDEQYEIWFEGRCSYFSLNWLNEQHKKLNDDEDADIVDDANDDEDIQLAIVEIFKQFM
jgi:hypothetical protein